LLRVQRKTPEDEQRNCPKHVEFYSKNKFEKLLHRVGFIIIVYHDASAFIFNVAYAVSLLSQQYLTEKEEEEKIIETTKAIWAFYVIRHMY